MGNCFSTINRKLRFRRREGEVVTPFGHTLFPQSEFSRSRQQQQAIAFAVAAALQQQHNINHGVMLPGGLIDPDRGESGESELYRFLGQFSNLMGLVEFPYGHLGERNANTEHSPLSINGSLASQQDQPTIENHASVICQLCQGEELGSWRLIDLIDRAIGEVEEDEQDEEDDPFEPLLRMCKVAEIREMPYHDQTETLKYNLNKLQEAIGLVQSQSEQFSEMGHRFMEAFDDDEEDEDRTEGVAGFLPRMVGTLFMDGTMLSSTMVIQYISILMVLERVSVGLRLPILQELNGLGPTFLTTAGENGYTEIFQGGREYDIIDIKRAFQTRNTTPVAAVERDVITLAISYKHRGKGSERICDDDLEAIVSFIKASHRSRIRFWIDAKLPPTDDGSFERWLKRGMRPYARYMTLICPSTDTMAHRFWIANERFVALASRGIFVFKGQEMYFNKGVEDFRELAKRMLTLLIGEQELPEGVRKDEEGKVSQWALGILGSKHNSGSEISSGPKIDELHVDDYSENSAILHIEDVVRRDGPITLPLVAGRTWNRQNPLMKGTTGHQEHQMKEWIGLSTREDKRLVYFLHTFLLFKMNRSTSVVLKVRLRDSYDSTSGNAIEEKVLMEVPNDDVRKMLAVTVPIENDWSVFSNEQ